MIVEKQPDKNALLRALPRLRGLKILVLGDLFLDEYVVGRAERLSREAPVPVPWAATPARSVLWATTTRVVSWCTTYAKRASRQKAWSSTRREPRLPRPASWPKVHSSSLSSWLA
jgi:hypothetical protein